MIIDSAASFGINEGVEEIPKSNRLLVFTANDVESARRGAGDCSHFIANHPEDLNDTVYTLGIRREHLPYRTFAVVGGVNATDIVFSTPVKAAGVASGVVFIFTGQGAQWPTMGATLLSEYPRVMDDLQLMEQALSTLGQEFSPSWSLSGM